MIPQILLGLGAIYLFSKGISKEEKEEANGLNAVKIKDFVSKQVLRTMPQEIINYIVVNFDEIYGSPFSSSFYSKPGQSWDFTPKDQIRVSDHWNFYSRDYLDPNSELKKHAITDREVKNNTHWTIAKKQPDGAYEIILSLPKKEALPKKFDNNVDLLATKQPNQILFKLEQKKAKSEAKKRQDARNKKIKNKNLWVSFDRTFTERISSRKFVRHEQRDQIGILENETPAFVDLLLNGKKPVRYKKSTLSNWKELKRKPKSV